jgi:hypothetical protein
VPAEQFVVTSVGFEPKRERIPHDRNNPDRLVDQDVERHAGEKNFGKTASSRVDQRHGRDQGRTGIAKPGKKPKQRIETETEIGSGDPDEVIHEEGKKPKKRLKLGAVPLLFLGRQDFELQFLDLFGGFHRCL